jgi:hypothetical protein
MALVDCKECGAKISDNAASCPQCGDVIREPKPRFLPLEALSKISIPVVLSVAGTVITALTFFSQDEDRKMEQTRKLIADAFDKDPLKQQYCILYVDHLLASGRISPQMTVSVLSTVAANSTNDNVRLDALKMMPRLLEQKGYEGDLKPLLVRGMPGLIPSLSEVEVLRREALLDLQALVDADESLRPALIAELSGLDRRWALLNRNAGVSPDPKQVRVGLELKLALLSLVQGHARAQGVAAGLVDLARSSPEFSKFATDQLDGLRMASPRTALRVIATAAIRSLDQGEPFPKPPDEKGPSSPPVFVVAADEAQRAQAERLAQALAQGGLNPQGLDVLGAGKGVRGQAPEGLEIRFSQAENEAPFAQKLAQAVEGACGQVPKLVGVSASAGVDPGTYEVWLPRR